MIIDNNASMKKKIEMRNNLEKGNKDYVDYNKSDDSKMDAFNNGTQFFNMGGKLENASGDLKASKDFIDGYNRGQRISNIRNYTSNKK